MASGGAGAGWRAALLASLPLALAPAVAQSPLVIDPQQGATPRPAPTPPPPPAPQPVPAAIAPTRPVELSLPPGPVTRPVAGPPRPVEAGPAQSAPRRAAAPSSPNGLPTPTADPLAIDPAADPILRLARTEAPAAEFRAAVSAAVARNAAFDEAVADVAEARAARDEAWARSLPIADFSFSSFKVIDRAFSNDPGNVLERQRPDRRTDAIVRVQQVLLDFGASRARIKAGNYRVLAAAAAVEDAGSQLALRAVAAWYGVYGYRTLVGLAEAFAASQRDLRVQTQERIRQGVAAPGDLAQVDGYIAAADSQLADFRRSAAGAEAQYVAVMGAAPPPDLRRAPTPDLSVVTREGLGASADTLPAVRAARAGASAARRDLRAATGDLFPTVSLGVDAGRYGVFETARDYDIRGNVTLNWRLGGGNVQRRSQTIARADAAEARVRRTRDEAVRDAEIAWADVGALEQARSAIEQNYLASRRSRDVLAERFRVSRGTLFDVIAAESNFFSVAARYIQTVTELDTARYILLARTGRLLPALGVDPGGLVDVGPQR